MKKWKCLNLGPKMPYLGIFGLELEDKQYCHIWNQHHRICLFAKFREKTKFSKFGTKITLLGYIGERILKNYCHILNQHPQICETAKFRDKLKMLNFETKNALFEYFWVEIWNQYWYIWSQHPRICLIAIFREKNRNA